MKRTKELKSVGRSKCSLGHILPFVVFSLSVVSERASSSVLVHSCCQSFDKVRREQNELKSQLVLTNDFAWSLDAGTSLPQLKYIAGVDISFIKGNEVDACACLVVLSWPELEVCY